MASGGSEWAFRLDLTEAEIIACLNRAKWMTQPSLWGHTWGRPYDAYETIRKVTLENHKLEVHFEESQTLTLTSPQGFSLSSDRTLPFDIREKDPPHGSLLLIIDEAVSVRWERTSPDAKPLWLVDFWVSRYGGSYLRETTGHVILWENYLVPGKPAFSTVLDL